MSVQSFWKPFCALFILGLLGILANIPALEITFSQQLKNIPNAPDLPIVVLASINPLILIIITILIGILLAPRLGLKSHIVEKITKRIPLWSSLQSDMYKAIVLGMITAVILYLLDLIFQPWLPESFQLNTQSRSIVITIGSLFYGGISEEIMIRWGLMSLVGWIGWRLIQRGKNPPKPWIMWVSILISSILFGIAHLGANAALAPLTWVIIVRMMLLNGIAGMVFGWLFWKKSLEAAMISHATVHIVITMIVWLKSIG